MVRQEFYADRKAFNLSKVTDVVSRVLWAVAAVVPLVFWLSRIFRWEGILSVFTQSRELALLYMSSFQLNFLIISFFVLSGLIGRLADIVKFVRKSWLYPSRLANREVTAHVRGKSFKNHSDGRKHHLVTIKHPYDNETVSVDVDNETYFRLLEGDSVTIRYNPEEPAIIYMRALKQPVVA